ncbi:MAG: hypothetical protein WB783_20245 [Arenicellales bacterium]
MLVDDDGLLARFTTPEPGDLVEGEVYVLAGGPRAWSQAGYGLEEGEVRLASEPIDLGHLWPQTLDRANHSNVPA